LGAALAEREWGAWSKALPMLEEVDIVVVGSGAAGMVAAARATSLGLRTVVVEKAHFYGGTSATSGGVMWIPNHGLDDHVDSPELAMTYLREVTGGTVREDRLRAFVDNAKRMAAYLGELGIHCQVVKGFPDYFPNASGAVPGRSIFVPELDGGTLGSDYFVMREPFFQALLFRRYSLDMKETAALVGRKSGWQLVTLKLFFKYWLDIRQRAKSRRDRRALRGGALVGSLRRALQRKNVPLYQNTALQEILMEQQRVTGVVVNSDGRARTIKARRGVILAAGGFEHNQSIRDANLPVKTSTRWSLTPAGENTGDALVAGMAVGADTEFMECMWWAPVMRLPWEGMNADVPYSMTNDQRHPNSIMVNRNGERFVNENCSYDQFGIAMVADQQRTGANVPCWLIFDANFREKYICGGIMPNILMPDRKVPRHWWDQYIYRAGTISELATKICVPAAQLEVTVRQFNGDAAKGADTLFGRGGNDYDRHWGDPRVKPNPCLGPIDKAPFYAVRIDLGDLGTKGGLKANANGQVVNREGHPIPGLYAVGNSSGCAFGNAYPGAGGTLGPAVTFAFIAANHLAGAV
jgi:3-oxosteroid 1-dehydrogenase